MPLRLQGPAILLRGICATQTRDSSRAIAAPGCGQNSAGFPTYACNAVSPPMGEGLFGRRRGLDEPRFQAAGARAKRKRREGAVIARLEGNARRQALADLKGWREEAGRDAIGREFRFADFNQAFAFMTQIALKAERMDHHPEWSNVYNRVSVVLSTHECGGVSERDIEMARFIDTLAA